MCVCPFGSACHTCWAPPHLPRAQAWRSGPGLPRTVAPVLTGGRDGHGAGAGAHGSQYQALTASQHRRPGADMGGGGHGGWLDTERTFKKIERIYASQKRDGEGEGDGVEVGLGGEWLSESSGSLGVTRSLWAGHSSCPGCAHLPVRLCPADTCARPGWPRGGHRMAVVESVWAAGQGGVEAAEASVLTPGPVPKRPWGPAGSQEAK